MRTLRDRLQDTLDAIGQIAIEAVKGKAFFDANPLIQFGWPRGASHELAEDGRGH